MNYVLASRNPHTGAYAIASIRRTIAPNALTIAPADVEWEIEDADAFVGVFGYFDTPGYLLAGSLYNLHQGHHSASRSSWDSGHGFAAKDVVHVSSFLRHGPL